MLLLITILIFIDCLLLIGVILIQESKGGGLASGFSSTSNLMGVQKTGDLLERSTWTLAIALLVLSLAAAYFQSGQTVANDVQQSEIKEFVEGEPITPPPGYQQQQQQPAQ